MVQSQFLTSKSHGIELFGTPGLGLGFLFMSSMTLFDKHCVIKNNLWVFYKIIGGNINDYTYFSTESIF